MTPNTTTRVRFAPSPTGYLHVGGARTALFNFLFARRTAGVFILRIEDTDRERSTDEATKAIFDGLNWLGLTPDEGPFFQSERTALYHDYTKKLLASGDAYQCTCTSEELERVREDQRANSQKPQYNRLHRPKTRTAQPTDIPTGKEATPFVIRLRCPDEDVTIFNDLVLGEVTTPNEEIDDFIIVRSDGSPTYNFTVVCDDIDMRITHVIRGMDHVSNTPKQIAIYKALGAEMPHFGHVPMILGTDKKKLSKRHGATSVIEYKKDGYLSDAFVNYLARLGWSHGDQEIFTRQELSDLFSLEHLGKSAGVFDFEKLLWVNAEHMKMAPVNTLEEGVLEFLAADGFQTEGLSSNKKFHLLLDSLRERAKTLKEMAEGCHWYLYSAETLPYDTAAVEKHITPEIKPILQTLIKMLNELSDFSEKPIEAEFHKIVEAQGLKLGKLAQPVRVAVTGTTVSPPIYTVLEILGKDNALKRLNRALALS